MIRVEGLLRNPFNETITGADIRFKALVTNIDADADVGIVIGQEGITFTGSGGEYGFDVIGGDYEVEINYAFREDMGEYRQVKRIRVPDVLPPPYDGRVPSAIITLPELLSDIQFDIP